MTTTPSDAAPAEHEEFRVLTLDGGGVRGLSSLYILRALMERVNNLREDVGEKPVKPCELFDLIGGTSTGGLIAIMLGRLKMDVDECIYIYQRLVKKVFDNPKGSVSRSWASLLQGTIKPKFESSVLQEQIAEVVKEKLQVENPLEVLLNDPSTKDDCHVFVCATSQTSTNTTTRLRSYKIDGVFGDVPSTIIQAALATSAATGFFQPVEIDGEMFVDGALSANNPAAEAFEELKSIHKLSNDGIEDRICCFVSIGTGHPGLNPISDKFWEMVHKQLLSILTETERTAGRIRETHKSLFNAGRAFRFNVIHGMDSIALDDWNYANEIKAKTRAYLVDPSNNNDFNQCAKQLVKAVGFKDQLFFQTRRSYYSIAGHWRIILWCLLIPIVTSYFIMVRNAKFIEENAPNYNRQAALDSSLPLFAVLGATGVGKSSFIATLGGRHVKTNEPPSIGHRLQSHTERCEIYQFSSLATGPGYLIDTPGIDESNRTRTDTEIMNMIQNELERVQIYDKMLMGLVYLYDIRQPRVYGSTLNALDTTINMIEYLLGANGVAKITLVTTKWTRDASEAVKKEEEKTERMLQDDYWQGPIRCGSTLERYDGTKASGIDILANLKTRRRRMYPDPSRCRMSLQAPIEEPAPATKKSHRMWMKDIADSVPQVLLSLVGYSDQSDATSSILIQPPWLWTPAWILIGGAFQYYLLLIIEERLRAAKVVEFTKYVLVAFAFYFFTIFRRPAWLALWAWELGKFLLVPFMSAMTYDTERQDTVPFEGQIAFTVGVSAGFIPVPRWLPTWMIYVAEVLRFFLLLMPCLRVAAILDLRKQRRTGNPRISMTLYQT